MLMKMNNRNTLLYLLLFITSFFLYSSFYSFTINNGFGSNQHQQIKIKADVPTKVFKKWEYDFPCYVEHSKTSDKAKGKDLRGLVFIKSAKCASTTLSGISLRIAHRHTTEKGSVCATTSHHMAAHKKKVVERLKEKTFLWTFVRKPTSQFLSHFFHAMVSRREVDPTFENLMNYANSQFTKSNYPQINVINYKKNSIDEINNNPREIVQEILNEYDFVGLVERLDESLVALRLLLGLDAGDILYLSSKTHGNYDDGLYKHKCVYIQPKVTTPEIDEYLSSEDWENKNYIINLMHEAVNQSLDLTIKAIGQSKFDKALSEHRSLQSLVQKTCASTAIYPCSDVGVFQEELSSKNCYESDFGCGYPCIDELYDNITKKNIQY